jgi:hypothetical protein
MKIDLVEKSGLEWDSMSLQIFCRWISCFSVRLYQLKIWYYALPFYSVELGLIGFFNFIFCVECRSICTQNVIQLKN